MKHIKVFCFALWLALCSSTAVNGQKRGFLILADNEGTQNQGTRVDEAVAWLGPVRKRDVAAGWQVSTYQVGDEGYARRHRLIEL
jgi:hypothetical protein